MEMEAESGGLGGLQRSEVSFRRQGSSGLVWEDRLVSGELKKKEEEEQGGGAKSVGSIKIERSHSNGRGYRTGKVTPDMDPPSPKVSGCGFCGAFGKPAAAAGRRSKTNTTTTTTARGKRKS